MNTKIYQYIGGTLMFLLLGLTYSCKKDLGNYEYTDTAVPRLDTTGISANFSIERYAVLTINPGIQFNAADTGRLNYQWLLYKALSGSVTEPPATKVIGNSRRLSTAIGEPIGSYQLELVVTDTKNDLKSNVIFNLNITTNLEYGVMVLHTRSNGGDVDFLITRNAVPTVTADRWLKNIYSQSQGMTLPGDARFIEQSRKSNSTENWINVASSTQITRVSGSDFGFIRENAGYFLRPAEVINPQAYVLSTTSLFDMLINNNRMYFINSTDPRAAIFPGAVTGDYSLAPFIAEASASSIVGAVYDTKKLKFMHPVSSNVMVDFRMPAASTQPFDLTNIGKTIIGMDRGFSNQTLNFFKDLTGNGRWLYVTNFNKADDGLMAVARYDMTALPDVTNATIFRSSEYGYAAFYATAHDVYLYDYAGTNTAKKAFSVPAAETITSMKIFKPKPNFNLSATDGRLLYIGTWDGAVGRVYELRINAVSGEVEPTVLNKFEGFGRIVDITAKGRGAGTL
ncbi:PKD-like family lipoprotein [Pedobacter sp. GR22-6]|uniref:PKD-like family lipoprotein n=1 Tax=Pedobacter sp. GR22-6 TaxID=3127957 RepID=UPI00307DA8A6